MRDIALQYQISGGSIEFFLLRAFIYVLTLGIGAIMLPNIITSFVDVKIMFGDATANPPKPPNPAYTAARAGMLLGAGWAATTLWDYRSPSATADLLWQVGGGAAVVAALLLLRLWVHMTVPFKPNVHDTVAVGVARGAYFWAAGVVMAGAFGIVTNGGHQIVSATIVFGLVSLLILLALGYGTGKLFGGLTSEAREGNNAAGVLLAGFVIAAGYILQGAISGGWVGWGYNLERFAFLGVLTVVLMYVGAALITRFMLHMSNLSTLVARCSTEAAIFVSAAIIAVGYGIGHGALY